MVRLMNRRVTIHKYVRIGDQWRYCRPVIGKNNRIKPDWVLFKGEELHRPDGDFYIRFFVGSKPVWQKVGPDAGKATREASYEESKRTALAAGLTLNKPPAGASMPLTTAITGYLEEVRLSRSPETHQLMARTLWDFDDFVHHTWLKDVTKLDLLRWAKHLQANGNSARTAANKFVRVHQFLKSQGIVIVKNGDAPRYVESAPEIYSQDELDKFLAACPPTYKVVFTTFLQAGLRMQELMFLTWDDVGPGIRVTAKPEWGFHPKAYHEREVTVPDSLITMLENLPKKHRLVFPTKSGRPNTHLLEFCKAYAKDAGLLEEDFYLHKFRSTFCTRLLQGGMDIESVRYQMGHKDIESISRYLVPLRGAAMKDKVNGIWK